MDPERTSMMTGADDASQTGGEGVFGPLGQAPQAEESLGDEQSTGAQRLGELASSNVLLVALVGAGLLGVFLLGLRNGPSEASAVERRNEIRVNAALQEMDGSMTKAENILETFYYEARERQVPLAQLTGNPFVFEAPEPEKVDQMSQDLRKRLDRDRRKLAGDVQEVLAAADSLQLQTVLSQPQGNVAVISDNLVTRGGQIEGWTVEEITDNRVLLGFEGRQHVLTLNK